jgi:hypothetical protein
MPRPQIVFIEGLPGSGKSTAAVAIGARLSNSLVFLESDAHHPLLVGMPDARGAAFADIHQFHSAGSFAEAALAKLEVFLRGAEGGVRYVFESHPIQSTARVLLQLDAPEASIMQFWSAFQDRLSAAAPCLVYLKETDPRGALIDTLRIRGPAWEHYLIEACNDYPWMRARRLSGFAGMQELMAEYSALMDRLVARWRFRLLTLTARPASYRERTDALIEWLHTSRCDDEHVRGWPCLGDEG